jgi:hypothetical protein
MHIRMFYKISTSSFLFLLSSRYLSFAHAIGISSPLVPLFLFKHFLYIYIFNTSTLRSNYNKHSTLLFIRCNSMNNYRYHKITCTPLSFNVTTINTKQQFLRILTFCIPMLQTHISENVGEVAAIRELYPECRNYADVYDRAGLLTNKVMSI